MFCSSVSESSHGPRLVDSICLLVMSFTAFSRTLPDVWLKVSASVYIRCMIKVRKGLFPICWLFFVISTVYFALQELCNFMRFHLLILDLTTEAVGVLYMNFSPVPTSSRLFSTFVGLGTRGFPWRSLSKLGGKIPVKGSECRQGGEVSATPSRSLGVLVRVSIPAQTS